MKIIKIIEKPMQPNEDGDWAVYCQMMVGNAYQYGVLLYQTFDEAKKAHEGDIIGENVRFERRINGVQL